MASDSEIRYLTPIAVETRKKKYCRFKRSGIKYIDYKDANFLMKFVNEQGKILPRRVTGNSIKFQRKVAQAIKRARHIAILPYKTDLLKQEDEKMEVILTQDIPKLGYKDDTIKVKDGYARNYLFPKNLAVMATETAKKVHAENVKQKAFKEEKNKNNALKTAEILKAATLKIGAKTGTSGKIFGSVNALQIAEAIKAQCNFDVDRKKIKVDTDSIKEIGTYTAKVDLHKEVKVDITFEVIAE